jgi:hypothetical protein
MKRGWNFQENVAEQIEKNPGGNDAGESENASPQPRQPPARDGAPRENFRQTGSAQHAALVLGNTFPAKVARASRAARDRFTRGMVPATLGN